MPRDFLKGWREAIEQLPMQSDAAAKELETQFRTLRLWHWNMARYHRNCANAYTPKSASASVHHAQADFHIKQVQLLNVFFDVGDTAEGDAAK